MLWVIIGAATGAVIGSAFDKPSPDILADLPSSIGLAVGLVAGIAVYC